MAAVQLRYPVPMTLILIAYALMLYYLITGQWFGSATAMTHQANVMMLVVWGYAFDRHENPPRPVVPASVDYDRSVVS